MGKKVIIVGAGIGGLATAIRLLSKGFEVKIYEKEDRIGGKVNRLETKSFKFDLTASILMTPEIYQELFTYTGRNYRAYLDFIRLDPIYRVNYPDGKSLDFSSDLVDLSKTLEGFSTEDAQGYLKFLADVYEKYLMANEYFLHNPFTKPTDFFNPISMMKALKLRTLTTPYGFISKYVKSEKIRQFIAFQSLYVGISPYQGPNIYTLVPAVSQIYGLWHLKGGMYAYVKAMERLINELGGTIENKSKVEEIILSEGRAIGVKTRVGTEFGDFIICNADFPYAVKELIKHKEAKGKYEDHKLKEMKHSCSTFILYLGLDKKYPKLQVHNHYLGEDFKENIEDAFKGSLPKKMSLYIYCPSRIDDTMAIKGHESLNIMVRVPNLLFKNIKWQEDTIGRLRAGILKTIRRIDGLEDMEEHIIYESYLTPKDLERRYNAYAGTAFGLSPTLTQTNYFRPHIKSPTIKNLYFVGSSVHPGAGVSIVLRSSKLVAEEILKDWKG